jgi:diguanylate cyclase (GGDEF)-like protein
MGDVVLAEISKIVRRYCRETDIPVRWGGEEFAVLLPETDLQGAVQLAERMRQGIETHQFEDVPHITASFGVASFKTDEQDLLTRADAALHKAKHSGRNSVRLSE